MTVFLDKNKLENLETIFCKLTTDKTAMKDNKNSLATGVDSKFYPIIEKILSDTLEPLIGKFKIHVAMLLEESYPLVIHTDYNKGDNNPGYAILIPLNTIETHTVIFNEECTDTFKNFKQTNFKSMVNATEYHDQLLSHCLLEDLEYVSLKVAEKWERGKIIIWNRKLLHSSDNFLKNDITTKNAIVIFTSRY